MYGVHYHIRLFALAAFSFPLRSQYYLFQSHFTLKDLVGVSDLRAIIHKEETNNIFSLRIFDDVKSNQYQIKKMSNDSLFLGGGIAAVLLLVVLITFYLCVVPCMYYFHHKSLGHRHRQERIKVTPVASQAVSDHHLTNDGPLTTSRPMVFPCADRELLTESSRSDDNSSLVVEQGDGSSSFSIAGNPQDPDSNCTYQEPTRPRRTNSEFATVWPTESGTRNSELPHEEEKEV